MHKMKVKVFGCTWYMCSSKTHLLWILSELSEIIYYNLRCPCQLYHVQCPLSRSCVVSAVHAKPEFSLAYQHSWGRTPASVRSHRNGYYSSVLRSFDVAPD